MTLNDINQAKHVYADTELNLAYAVVERIETIVDNGGTVLDISNVEVLAVPKYDTATSTLWMVGRTILFNEAEAKDVPVTPNN